MREPSSDESSPVFFKVHIRIRRWHNRARVSGEPLIATQFLEHVNNALDAFERWKCEKTLPFWGEEFRLIQSTGLVLVFSTLNECRERLREALEKLSAVWNEVLEEGQARLGDNFETTEYPDAKGLADLWSVEWEFNPEDWVRSPELLGQYSLFHEAPPQPTIWDAKEWTRQMMEEHKKPEAERRLPPWPPDRSGES